MNDLLNKELNYGSGETAYEFRPLLKRVRMTAIVTKVPQVSKRAARCHTNTRDMKLTLPYPPSANRYWRQGKHGRVYVSPEAESYKNDVFWLCVKQKLRPFKSDVILRLDVYRPRKSGDLSNRIKVLEDALIGNAYVDDKQVVEIHARRFDDKTNPRVEIDITEV